jgi:hypothetical protein
MLPPHLAERSWLGLKAQTVTLLTALLSTFAKIFATASLEAKTAAIV